MSNAPHHSIVTLKEMKNKNEAASFSLWPLSQHWM